MRFALTVLITFAASPCLAQSPNTASAEQAKVGYEQGVELFKAKKFSEAIAEFNRAYRLDPSPILLYNIARAFEELREYTSAVDFYRQYLASGETNDRPAIEQTIRTLEILAKQQAATVQTAYSLASDPPGAQVIVADKVLGTTPITLTLDRGKYSIELRKDGHEPETIERTFTDAKQSDSVTLRPKKGTEIGGVTFETAEASTRSVWGWTAVGVGTALAVGAVFTGQKAQEHADRLDEIDADPGAFNDDDFDAAQSDGRALGITTDVLWGLGAVSIGTGVWLLLTDDAPTATGWMASPTGVAWRGQF